jgi:hypothetical protein
MSARLARNIAGIAVVLLMGIAGAYVETRPIPVSQMDTVTYNETRFVALKRALPTHGVVGYISDLDLSNDEGTAAWYLAQYSLAPLQVYFLPNRTPGTTSPIFDVAVGNFQNSNLAAALAARNGFVVERDFGAGAMLLSRVKQP